MLFEEELGKAVHVAQRRAQVMRDGVGEGLQFFVRSLEFGHALPQGADQFLDFSLCPLGLSDVAGNRGGANHLAGGVRDRGDRQRDVDLLAILSPAPGFIVFDPLALDDPCDNVAVLVLAAGEGEDGYGLTYSLLCGVAKRRSAPPFQL